MEIGTKIAQARREQGITQVELANKMSVTRQTVSRWETGAAVPDIEKVAELAGILQVSCDYLLLENRTGKHAILAMEEKNSMENMIYETAEGSKKSTLADIPCEMAEGSKENALADMPCEMAGESMGGSERINSVTKLLSSLEGKNVRISFYEDEEDEDAEDKICKVDCFEGNWIKVIIQHKKREQKKLIALSSILSFEIVDEGGR